MVSGEEEPARGYRYSWLTTIHLFYRQLILTLVHFIELSSPQTIWHVNYMGYIFSRKDLTQSEG